MVKLVSVGRAKKTPKIENFGLKVCPLGISSYTRPHYFLKYEVWAIEFFCGRILFSKFHFLLDKVDEAETFEGSENSLTMKQTYTHEFQCQYQLNRYPFDTQVWKGSENRVTEFVAPLDVELPPSSLYTSLPIFSCNPENLSA